MKRLLKFIVLPVMLLAMSAKPGMVSNASPAAFDLTTKAPKQVSYVLICVSPTAYAYHDHICQGLKKCSHDIERVTEKDAIGMGRKACGYCY